MCFEGVGKVEWGVMMMLCVVEESGWSGLLRIEGWRVERWKWRGKGLIVLVFFGWEEVENV